MAYFSGEFGCKKGQAMSVRYSTTDVTWPKFELTARFDDTAFLI